MDERTPAQDRRSRDRALDGALVERIRSGDEAAFAELFERWFDRVCDLSFRIVRDLDVAAEVAQDAFLAAWQQLGTLEDPASFGGWVLRTARNRSLNRLERERRARPVDDEQLAAIEAGGPLVSAPAGFGVEDRLARAEDPEAAVEDAELVELLWGAADALPERDRTVLSLSLREGMTPAEIGSVLGINRNAANQLVHRVKGRLASAVEARVLFEGDQPRCPVLEAELIAAGVDAFGPGALPIAERHAEDCEECGERRRLRLQPAALFGALPVLAVPQLLRERVAAALVGHGVPVEDAVGAGRREGDPGEGGGADGGPGPAGAPEAGDLPPGGARHWRRPSRVLGAAAAVVLVAGLVILAAWLLGGDDEPSAVVAADATAPVTLAETAATEESPATADDDAVTTTVAPPTTAPPSLPAQAPPPPPQVAPAPGSGGGEADTSPEQAPPLPPPPPPAPVLSLELLHSPAPQIYRPASPQAPRLRWSVVGEGNVSLSGPGVVESAASGEVVPCPGQVMTEGSCLSQPGSYRYTLSVRSSAGVLLGQRAVTLVIE